MFRTSLQIRGGKKNLHPSCTVCRVHFPPTSVAIANHVRKVGEPLVAVVTLAAAEEHLRVFLHGDAFLPKTANENTLK